MKKESAPETQDDPPPEEPEEGPVPTTNARGWNGVKAACRAHRVWSTVVGLVLFVALVLGFADVLLAGPMRAWAERTMNAQLNGYTVRIGRVRPHLWRLAFDLDDLVLAQNTHPDPPVADFGALKFSMLLGELLRFNVAGDLTLDRPALHINLAQIEEEARSHVSLKDRGWQRAVEAVFPIKLDRVKVQDGSLLYLSSRTASKPLQFTKVFLLASNVRNIAAAKGTYPSPVSLEGVLFDTGKVRFKGTADFLRTPYAAASGELHLDRIPLDRLDPLAQDYQLKTKGGFLSVNGSVEYTPESQRAHLTEVLLENLQVDYITSNATKALELEHRKQAVKLAKSVRNAPQLLLQVDILKLTNSQLGFVNEATEPKYRLFISDMSLELANLSNQVKQGKSDFQARGSFMGSGTAALSGRIKSTARPINLEVQLELENAKLPALNGFLMAHLGVDVAGGLFSVFTEATVKDGKVEGYLKPLFKELKIYDKRKDKGKSFGKRVEMHVLQFLANVFKNRSTQEVSTVIRISGSTSDPKANEWEAIRKLLGNGFSQAVRPGFLEKPGSANPSKPAPPSPDKPG